MKDKMISFKKNIKWFIVYFCIMAGIGIFVRDAPGQPDLLTTITDILKPGDLSDTVSFAKGALDIHRYGWFSEENQWLIVLWPPGFMFLEGLILNIFGVDAPIILILIILESLLLALLLSIFKSYLSEMVSTGASFILPLLPFCFPLTRYYLLQPGAIIYGEAFSMVFFLLTVVITPIAVKNRSWRSALIAGLMLALAAYFRSQFELIVMFLTLFAIFIGIVVFIQKIKNRTINTSFSALQTIAIVLFAAHLVMLPWRVHNFTAVNKFALLTQKKFSWVQTSQFVYANAGRTDKELNDAGGEFIVRGGGNLACNLDPSYCGRAEKSKFFRAFRKNIVQWSLTKFSLVRDYWFVSPGGWLAPADQPFSDKIVNWIFFFFVLAAFPLLWCTRRHRNSLINFWVLSSFYSCFFAVFLVVHFEARYFYAIKLFSAFYIIMLSCTVWQLFKEKKLFPLFNKSQ